MDRANFELKAIFMTGYLASCFKLVFKSYKNLLVKILKHSFLHLSELALRNRSFISFLFATSSTLSISAIINPSDTIASNPRNSSLQEGSLCRYENLPISASLDRINILKVTHCNIFYF